MRVVPLTLAQANAYIDEHHRHHKPVQGHRFSIGAEIEGRLVGVCVIGRPVARKTDQYRVVEVTRLCTDGTPNACSFLYSAAARVAGAMGFDRIQTFILDTEPGTSLRASGWEREGESRGRDGWHSRDGRREDQPETVKVRYGRALR